MTALYVPFTIAHGPTSIDRDDDVLGAGTQVWGLLLGAVPCVPIGLGLWRLRGLAAGASRTSSTARTVVASLLLLSPPLQDLVSRALGPPLVYVVLVPALLTAVVTHRPRGAGDPVVPVVSLALASFLLAGLLDNLFLQEVENGFGNYRMATFLLDGAGGLAWAALGLALSPNPPAVILDAG